MKKPRVEDFDPNAAPPLGSPIDDYPTIEKPTSVMVPEKSSISDPVAPLKRSQQQHPTLSSAPSEDTPNHNSPPSPIRTNEPTNLRSFERSNERMKIRHTFDIFADQLISLREISLQRELTFGKRTLLGDLVQEALDLFITKERNKE